MHAGIGARLKGRQEGVQMEGEAINGGQAQSAIHVMRVGVLPCPPVLPVRPRSHHHGR